MESKILKKIFKNSVEKGIYRKRVVQLSCSLSKLVTVSYSERFWLPVA